MKAPGFTILVTTALALGIAASTAMLTIYDQVFFRPLPFPDASQIVSLRRVRVVHTLASVQVDADVRTLPILAAIGLYQAGGVNIGDADGAVRVNAAVVDAGFFHVLGAQPIAGRFFSIAEGDSAAHVALISERLWSKLGRRDLNDNSSLIVNERPFRLIGVMSGKFTFPLDPDIWIPLRADPGATGPAFSPEVVARLVPGVSVAEAEETLTALATGRSGRIFKSPSVLPLRDLIYRDSRALVSALGLLIALVFAATCFNVAGLWICRFDARAAEMTTRVALGAPASAIVAFLLVEPLLVTLLASCIGLSASVALLGFAGRALPALALAGGTSYDIARLFGVATGVIVVCTLTCAIAPAVALARNAPARLLQQWTGGAPWTSRVQRWIAVAEVGIGLVLILVTATVSQTVWRLARVDVGFGNLDALVFELGLPASRYQSGLELSDFVSDLGRRLRAQSVAADVGATTVRPGDVRGMLGARVSLPSESSANTREGLSVVALLATPEYFRAAGISLMAGRPFEDQDGQRAPAVFVLSLSAAKNLSATPMALVGSEIVVTQAGHAQRGRVVGIAADVRLQGPVYYPAAAVYQPLSQGPSQPSIAVIVANAGTAAVSVTRQALHEMVPLVPPYNMSRLDDLIRKTTAMEQLTLKVALWITGVAILLCVSALHGVLLQDVQRRRQELGIRLALGAHPHRLACRVVASSLWLTILGVAIGIGGFVVVLRLAGTFLPTLESPSTMAFAAGVSIPFLVGAIASVASARAAATVDPLFLLRSE